MKITKAVIPAAGLGTRFLPYTKSSPKEMLPVVDKPTLQIIVEEIVKSGIKDILIIISPNKVEIKNHFETNKELEDKLRKSGKVEQANIVEELGKMANIQYVVQTNPRGSADAVRLAKDFVNNEPFAMLYGDDVVYNGEDETPCLKQLIDCYDKTGKTVLGVQKVDLKEISKYGVIKYSDEKDGIYKVDSVIEKPKGDAIPSNLASLGRYVVLPTCFDIIETLDLGVGNELQFTDALKKQAENGDVVAIEFTGRRYDLGDKLGYLQATVEYGLRDEKLCNGFKEYLKELCKKF